MTSQHVLTSSLFAVTLLLCGAYAGMSLMCQIGILPAMRKLDLRAYAEAWRQMDSYMDRAMPPYKLSLLAVTLASAISLALQGYTSLAALTGVSFLCSLMALVLTVRKQLPLNAKLRTLTNNTDDTTLLEIREQTVHNFTVRFVLAVVSFGSLCVGLALFPIA